MIGMDFTGFLILLVISIVVSAVLHYGIKYHITAGFWSFLGKVIIGYIGAMLGSPVFGHWFDGANYEQIYFIPAILGSFALIILVIDITKSFSAASK